MTCDKDTKQICNKINQTKLPDLVAYLTKESAHADEIVRKALQKFPFELCQSGFFLTYFDKMTDDISLHWFGLQVRIEEVVLCAATF